MIADITILTVALGGPACLALGAWRLAHMIVDDYNADRHARLRDAAWAQIVAAQRDLGHDERAAR